MGILDRPKAVLHRVRTASPALDHAMRAYARYNSSGGSRLGASVTLPGFLSFFPLVAVAFLVLAFVLSGSASAQVDVLDSVKGYLPGLLCTTVKGVHNYPCTTSQINVNSIQPKSGAGILSGVIGVLGLVFAGTGWVNNLRTALRTIWRQDQSAGNFLVKKVKDIAIMIALGVALLASVTVSGLATSATSGVLDDLGLGHSIAANVVLKVIGVGVSIAVNVVLFLILFTQLGDGETPVRALLRGSILAGALLEVLQVFGSTYLAHTTGNPLYGIFAVVIGLILYIGLVVQITLLAAAWTVTAPYLDDIAPVRTPPPLPYPEGPSLPPGPLETGTTRSALADLVPEPAGSTSARVAGVAGVGVLAATAAGVAVYGIRSLRDATR